MFGEGWLRAVTPAALSDLSFVSSHPGPPPPSSLFHQQKDLSGEEGGRGGTSFMTSLPFFFSTLPFGFQAHSFLPRPRESGGGPPFISLPGN